MAGAGIAGASTAMTLALAPHVYIATIGDDVVLLDTIADAYVCVPDGVRLIRPSSDHVSLAPADDAVLAAMIDAGLVEEVGAPAPRRIPRRPTADLGEPGAGELHASDVLAFVGALWDLLWRYRGRTLGEIIRFATRDALGRSDVVLPGVARRARAFQRLAVWLPMPRKCLVRSFVLLRFLQRTGCSASWVFGVTTWPFRAHCWLQVGETILDDTADRIVEYEPILRIN